MFCQNCGNKIKEDAKFCSSCGTDLVKSVVIKNSKEETETTAVTPDKKTGVFNSIISVLSSREVKFALNPLNERANNTVITSKITGGNLAVICHLIGSTLTIDTNDKIVFLEDVNEKGYHVHRYLLQMKNAGLFSGVRALIFGDFANSDDKIIPSIKNFCDEHLSIPAFTAQGIGHLESNYPIIIGGDAEIRSSNLTVKSPFGLI